MSYDIYYSMPFKTNKQRKGFFARRDAKKEERGEITKLRAKAKLRDIETKERKRKEQLRKEGTFDEDDRVVVGEVGTGRSFQEHY